jgi:chloride channel 7
MIHLGSLVAAGMSQFKSATFECTLPFFSRFRNSEDRRNFISAGAAAGIASGMDGKIRVHGKFLALKAKRYFNIV